MANALLKPNVIPSDVQIKKQILPRRQGCLPQASTAPPDVLAQGIAILGINYPAIPSYKGISGNFRFLMYLLTAAKVPIKSAIKVTAAQLLLVEPSACLLVLGQRCTSWCLRSSFKKPGRLFSPSIDQCPTRSSFEFTGGIHLCALVSMCSAIALVTVCKLDN